MSALYEHIEVLCPPYSQGPDGNGCWIYAVNIECWKAPSTGATDTVEELGALLENAGLTEVYRRTLPDRDSTGTKYGVIGLIEYPGRQGLYGFGGVLLREYPRVQLVVRGEQNDTLEPRQRADLAYLALGAVENQTLP